MPSLNQLKNPVSGILAASDLLFHFQEDEQGLLLDINYNSDIFSPARIQRYAAHFSALIADMIANLTTEMTAHQSVEQLNILPGAELKQLQRWGQGESVKRPSDTIPTLFTKICHRHASAIALYDESSGEMTYQQLQEAVHLLAKGLLASGCTPGDVIALAYHRQRSSYHRDAGDFLGGVYLHATGYHFTGGKTAVSTDPEPV
ncbi:hypothetical protein P4S72_07830 [Vibrio sp. PP-XX7]